MPIEPSPDHEKVMNIVDFIMDLTELGIPYGLRWIIDMSCRNSPTAS
jgi:hypothetical protein